MLSFCNLSSRTEGWLQHIVDTFVSLQISCTPILSNTWGESMPNVLEFLVLWLPKNIQLQQFTVECMKTRLEYWNRKLCVLITTNNGVLF